MKAVQKYKSSVRSSRRRFEGLHAYPCEVQMLEKLRLDKFTERVFAPDDGGAAFAAQMTGKYPRIPINCNTEP